MHERRSRRMGSGTTEARPSSRHAVRALIGTAALAAGLTAPASAQHGPAVISLTHQSAFSAGNSFTPSISGDGRLMAFTSQAFDLVPDDTDVLDDVFVRDRLTGTLVCISRAPDGSLANGPSGQPAISANGRFVVFASEASNLVPGDTNGFSDIFAYDLRGGTLERVNVASDGTQADLPCFQPTVSADGRMVAFESYSTSLAQPTHPGVSEIFVRDRLLGQTFIASAPPDGSTANGSSGSPHLSLDGRRVTFESWADNLGPGDLHFGVDVWLTDLETGKVVLVSSPPGGGQAQGSSYNPRLNGDGSLVVFDTGAKNLVEGDTNNAGDVVLADVAAGTFELISVSSTGGQGNTHSGSPSVTGNGRFVTFSSYAATLVPGDTNGVADVFVRDRWTGETVLLSSSVSGALGDGQSAVPTIAATCNLVIFESWAGNLVPGDHNEAGDIFVRNLEDLLSIH